MRYVTVEEIKGMARAQSRLRRNTKTHWRRKLNQRKRSLVSNDWGCSWKNLKFMQKHEKRMVGMKDRGKQLDASYLANYCQSSSFCSVHISEIIGMNFKDCNLDAKVLVLIRN